jgi:N-acetyl-gamma-glutamyl-phosphate reductase
VIPAVRGIDRGLKISDSDPAALAAADIELWFLALPHGAAATYAKALVAAGRKRVIDLQCGLSHRGPRHLHQVLRRAPRAGAAAGRALCAAGTHPAGVEDRGPARRRARLLPTSIIVPLAPLLKANIVTREHIVVNSFSGVSGAGKKAEEAYLFCERAESAKAYGLVKRRHLAEVEEQLARYSGAPTIIQFNPHLAPMRRGSRRRSPCRPPRRHGRAGLRGLARRVHRQAFRSAAADRRNAGHRARGRHESHRRVGGVRCAHRQFRAERRRRTIW